MTTKTHENWQKELEGTVVNYRRRRFKKLTLIKVECSSRDLAAPAYNIISDRRGGRTAWTATVTVGSTTLNARYWYDGQYVNNAKEDVAEVACCWLRGENAPGMKGPSTERGKQKSSNDQAQAQAQ